MAVLLHLPMYYRCLRCRLIVREAVNLATESPLYRQPVLLHPRNQAKAVAKAGLNLMATGLMAELAEIVAKIGLVAATGLVAKAGWAA